LPDITTLAHSLLYHFLAVLVHSDAKNTLYVCAFPYQWIVTVHVGGDLQKQVLTVPFEKQCPISVKNWPSKKIWLNGSQEGVGGLPSKKKICVCWLIRGSQEGIGNASQKGTRPNPLVSEFQTSKL